MSIPWLTVASGTAACKIRIAYGIVRTDAPGTTYATARAAWSSGRATSSFWSVASISLCSSGRANATNWPGSSPWLN